MFNNLSVCEADGDLKNRPVPENTENFTSYVQC